MVMDIDTIEGYIYLFFDAYFTSTKTNENDINKCGVNERR